MRGRAIGMSVVLVVLALVVAATAGAARIVGTDRNDVLRGTPGPDRILGGKGNDHLLGLGGNDVLTGGPGRDRFSCGAGRDTVNAERGEAVAEDCEIVRRTAPPQPPAPPAPTPPPPTPPTPQAPALVPGKYCGYTQQGPGICLATNAAGQVIDQLETGAIVDCSNGDRFTLGVSFQGGRAAIQPDLSFTYTYSGPLSSEGSDISNVQATYRISGRFTSTGEASGSVAVASLSFTFDGETFTCSQNDVTWTAKR